ncbi:hypothetical protein [Streptomyces sp. NPDC002952]|uniref:hypothetical protein n=1 Tax=Streptomyces sp. NPDC002952 TaxID=3364673 RepID=UPI0036CD8537
MTVAEALTSARPQLLGRRLSPAIWVSLLTVALALALALAATTLGGPVTVVVLLCVFAGITGLVYPVQRKLMNDAIPKDAPRATLLSVESILDRAVCALAAIAAGRHVPRGRPPGRPAMAQRLGGLRPDGGAPPARFGWVGG